MACDASIVSGSATSMTKVIFHLAFPVHSLQAAKDFYCKYLGAAIGRENPEWADIMLFGHQITLHERPSEVLAPEKRGIRHFGVILPWEQWQALGERLSALGCPMLMEPTVVRAGSEVEQGKILLCDPSANVVEIKAYRDIASFIDHADEFQSQS